METSLPQAIFAGAASPQANPPDRVILVYDGDGGLEVDALEGRLRRACSLPGGDR